MKIKILFCVFAIGVMLSGCSFGHEHIWQEATCESPKVCSDCGETEGEPIGHQWEAATCDMPKTCSVCGITEGTPFEHQWEAATCEKAKTCKLCGKIEGKANGHQWEKATCEKPMTCKSCGKIEGEANGHVLQSLSCTEGDICQVCEKEFEALDHDWVEATCIEPKKCSRCDITEGKELGHDTTNGICSRCGTEIHNIISGKGDYVAPNIEIGDSNYRVHIVYSGKKYKDFIINCIDENGVAKEIVNEREAYDGYVIFNPSGMGPYTFEIKSTGTWSIQIEDLKAADNIEFSGKGDTITSTFENQNGTWLVDNDGKGDFKIVLHYGDKQNILVDNYGNFEGRVSVKIPDGESGFFEIISNGNWSVRPLK